MHISIGIPLIKDNRIKYCSESLSHDQSAQRAPFANPINLLKSESLTFEMKFLNSEEMIPQLFCIHIQLIFDSIHSLT